LIIDLDSQANTTYAAGLVKFLDEENDDIRGKNITQVLQSKDEYQIEEVAKKASYSKYEIDVLPSHIELMDAETKLNAIEPAKTRLLNKLNKVKDKYDIVIIDTPPSLNLYARIALITAHFLVIPSDLKPFSHEGLNNVKNFISQIDETKEMYGLKNLKILGVLPSKISTNSKFLTHNYPRRRELVKSKYNFPVLDSMICEREDLAKCLESSTAFGDELIPDPRSVLDFKQDSPSSHEFEVLAMEILDKIN
jgi:cellulose biosynthesis protein BcsQ